MEQLLGIVDHLEMNVLHRAVKNNQLEAVKELLKSGADITNTINAGQTPLHVATLHNYHSIMRELIEAGTRESARQLINTKTFDTDSAALHIAAKNNSIKIVRFLLDHGANFEIENKDNQRPIDLITDDDSIKKLLKSIEEVFELTISDKNEGLVGKLESCSSENLATIMRARNLEGYTALQVAIDKGNLQAVASIVESRINHSKQYVSWKTGTNKLDKLMQCSKAVRHYLSNLEAISCREENIFCPGDYLLNDNLMGLLKNSFELLTVYKEQGDSKFINQPILLVIDESFQFYTCEGIFKIDDNRIHGSTEDSMFAVKLLKMTIIAPMLLFMKSVYTSELLEAAKKNNLILVKKCLTGHPDLNEVDSKDWTALHYAFYHVNTEMTKLLLDFGADPMGSSDKQKETPLLAAIFSSANYNSIMLLLNLISDEKLLKYLDAKDSRGLTALQLAVKLRYEKLVELLLMKGSIYCTIDQESKLFNPNFMLPTTDENKLRNIQDKLRCIDELFALALKGNTEQLIEKLEIWKFKYAIVNSVRNIQGCTLIQLLGRLGHDEVAVKVRKILSKADDDEKSIASLLSQSDVAFAKLSNIR